MRRWMAVVLIFVSIISFLILFRDSDRKQFGDMESAEYVNMSYRIMMPSEIASQPQEEVYKKISDMLDKYKGNIYYDRLLPGTNNTVKYIYFTNMKYFESIILAKGRSFEPTEKDSEKFISTENTGDENQIGLVADFGGNDFFEVKTLKSMIKDNQLYNGYCNVQFYYQIDINSFINELSDKLGAKAQLLEQSSYRQGESNFIYVITIVFYILLMLLVLYDIFKSYKKIGIQKMLGYSIKSIWTQRVLFLVGMQFIIFALTAVVCSLIEFKVFNQFYWSFMLKLLIIDVMAGIISFLVYSIPFLYVNKVRVSDIIKNRQPLRVVMAANIVIKICFMVFFVLAVNILIQNLGRIREQFIHSYSQWEKTKGYAVVPSYRDIDLQYSISDEYITKAKQIYEYFNKKGALLADFKNFRTWQQILDKEQLPESWKRDWANINPNYLIENPIYDEEDKQISVSETDSDYIVLIPEKYRPLETSIREYLDYQKKGYPESDKIPLEKIKIIWTKSGQGIFSYNMEVNPNSGNMVVDPLVRVVTEANASKFDYLFVAFYNGSPFKIKVNDSSNPSESILPELKELKLDIYRPAISSVYDAVGAEIKSVNELTRSTMISIIALLLVIILIIYQNIYSYFAVNRQRLVIEQFHGYKKIDKYFSYFLLVILSWIIIFNLVFLTKGSGILNITEYTASIEFVSSINFKNISILVAAFTVIEIVMSLIALVFVEKRKTVNIIKGS